MCGTKRKGDGGFRAGAWPRWQDAGPGVVLPLGPPYSSGEPSPRPHLPEAHPDGPPCRVSWSCSEGLSLWAWGGETRQRRACWVGPVTPCSHPTPATAPLHTWGQRKVLGKVPSGAGDSHLARPCPEHSPRKSPLTLRKLRVISRNSLMEVPRVGLSNSTSSRRGAASDPALESRPSSMPHLMVTSLPCHSPLYTWMGHRDRLCRRPLPLYLVPQDP